MKDNGELIREQSAEQRWPKQESADNFTDNARLAEPMSDFAGQTRRDQNRQQLDQREGYQSFRFVNRNSFRGRENHVASVNALKIDNFRMWSGSIQERGIASTILSQRRFGP